MLRHGKVKQLKSIPGNLVKTINFSKDICIGCYISVFKSDTFHKKFFQAASFNLSCLGNRRLRLHAMLFGDFC